MEVAWCPSLVKCFSYASHLQARWLCRSAFFPPLTSLLCTMHLKLSFSSFPFLLIACASGARKLSAPCHPLSKGCATASRTPASGTLGLALQLLRPVLSSQQSSAPGSALRLSNMSLLTRRPGLQLERTTLSSVHRDAAFHYFLDAPVQEDSHDVFV